MKTALGIPFNYSSLNVAGEKNALPEKAKMKVVLKTDLMNHRFAILENNKVQDPSSWDEAWFGNYE
jgi:hypothetical protein